MKEMASAEARDASDPCRRRWYRNPRVVKKARPSRIDATLATLYAGRVTTTRHATDEPQTAPAVLMVRPAHFAANPETSASNFFQSAGGGEDVTARAQQEFDALAVRLGAAGVRVLAFAGRSEAALPDEVFPNNWLSLHADGTAVVYPLLAANRRPERRLALLDELRRAGYRIDRVVDLTALEQRGQYLEGTGSLVLDRSNRIAYAALSPRTHRQALAEFGRLLGYEIVSFDTADRAGRPVYHTNVLMSVGGDFAAICSAAIRDGRERQRVLESLAATGREIIELTPDQMHAFAGNLLALRGAETPVIALSAAAHASLLASQRAALAAHGELVTADLSTIERFGGGSVRCMLTEITCPGGDD
jgi:hypothetical protein